MTFSSLRLFSITTAIILFGLLLAADVRSQTTLDRETQRNGMHSCPEGQFVLGVHVRDNLLLCSRHYGNYLQRDEVTTQREGMLTCPSGMAMTGLHARDNRVACAPVARSSQRYVDAANNTQVNGVVLHTCPSGDPVSGIDVSRNLLVCGAIGPTNTRDEFVDAATMRNDMHSCSGGFIVGVHISRNLLLCSRKFGAAISTFENVYKTPAPFSDMPICPEGMAMTGMHVRKKWITCTRVDAPPTQRVVDSDTQREGMHACPERKPMAGLDVRGNHLICGTHGTPLRDPRIDRVEPAEPIIGQSFDVWGENFGAQQERWELYLYQPARHRETITYSLEILQWADRRIRAKLLANLPDSSELPTGTHYALQIVVPGRLLASNQVRVSLAKATRPPDISRAEQPWIRAIHIDRGRGELWIYGRGFRTFHQTSHDQRGVPGEPRVFMTRNNVARFTTQILDWELDRLIVTLVSRCEPGTYSTQLRIDPDSLHWTNEMPVTLDGAFCRLSYPEGDFMHIDAVEPEPMSRVGEEPTQYARPGDELDIFGKGFDSEGRADLGVRQGRRVVELIRVAHGRAQVVEAPVGNFIRGERRQGVQWSDTHILVEIPRDIEPADYMLSIWDKSARRRSNNIRIRIVAREPPRR